MKAFKKYTSDKTLSYVYNSKNDSFCTARKFKFYVDVLNDSKPLSEFLFHLFDLTSFDSKEQFLEWVRNNGGIE